jgi:hypothetical protein
MPMTTARRAMMKLPPAYATATTQARDCSRLTVSYPKVLKVVRPPAEADGPQRAQAVRVVAR